MSVTEILPSQYEPQEIEQALEFGNADRVPQDADQAPRSYALDYVHPTQEELLNSIDRVEKLYETEPIIAACRSYMKEQGDEDTVLHSDRTAILTAITAKRAGLPDEEINLGIIAAACHDVGRSTPEIQPIVKSPLDFRKLSPQERKHYMQVIDLHTEIGAEMVRAYTKNENKGEAVAQIVAGHHAATKDRPHGTIPADHTIITEIVALVDELDALASTRSYKPTKSEAETRSILENQFAGNPDLIKLAFRSESTPKA